MEEGLSNNKKVKHNTIIIMLPLYLATALISVCGVRGDNWDSWWTYEGISGPEYWGVLNQDWTMCNKGRSQSPVNINPGQSKYFH